MKLITTLKAFLLIVLTASACMQVAYARLPQMGDPASEVFTPEEEYSLRRPILFDLRQKLDVIDDAELNYYVNNLGARLTSVAEGVHFPFKIIIVNSPEINAFALPSGVIVLNQGLIEIADDEEELAAVLAHEIAHVTQRHIARFYKKNKGLTLKTALGTLAAIIASSYSAEAGQAALISSLAAQQREILSFTRENEKEADRIGRNILISSGYSPLAMQRFFEKLKRQSLVDAKHANEFLQTHPLPDSRIADILLSTSEEKIESTQRVFSNKDFFIVQARLIGLHESHSTTTGSSLKSQVGALYLDALRKLRNNRPTEAMNILRKLPETDYTALPFRLLLADIFLAQHDYEKAGELLTSLKVLFPDHPAVVEKYTMTLIEQGKSQQAWNQLNQNTELYELSLNLLKIKADAANNINKPANSHEAMAEYYYYSGDTKLALEQIKLALEESPLSRVMRARLEQNVSDLTTMVNKSKK